MDLSLQTGRQTDRQTGRKAGRNVDRAKESERLRFNNIAAELKDLSQYPLLEISPDLKGFCRKKSIDYRGPGYLAVV